MGLIEKELFHGAVLAKIIRSDQPVSLKMIEMNSDQSRSAYAINIDTYLYIKSSKNPKPSERIPGAITWLFTFNTNHLIELNKLKAEKDVCLALVCAQTSISKSDHEDDDKERPLEIGFLRWDQIFQCLDLSNKEQQSITVRYKKGCSLEVWGSLNTSKKPIKVKQDALEKWKVPGS
jgi:hypothetical protein